jgi:hypothetical protein
MDNGKFTMLDLCSGLGGASRAAVDRGWRVITLDLEGRFRPSVVADVRAAPLKKFPVDLLWASPPCDQFSRLGMPWSWQKSGRGWKEPRVWPNRGVALARACISLVQFLDPDWWVIENVWSSRQYLEPFLGPVQASVSGHIFWGHLPGLIPETRPHKANQPQHPARAARRALIPYEIGDALCAAVERACEAR